MKKRLTLLSCVFALIAFSCDAQENGPKLNPKNIDYTYEVVADSTTSLGIDLFNADEILQPIKPVHFTILKMASKPK